MFKKFIGIDVSKSSFNYCVIDSQQHTVEKGVCEMNVEGFQMFKDVVKRNDNAVIALESTGSYHVNILSFIASFKKEVCLINPVLIKKFIQTISLRKTKTDEIDANLIAKFIFFHYAQSNYFTPSNMDEIVALARVRENISKEVAKMKTRLKQDLNTTFPELPASYNIFTDTILNLIENFPTIESIRNAKITKIKGVMKNKRGRNSSFDAHDIKELAKNSVSKNNGIYGEIIRHDATTLKFLLEELDKITTRFIKEIKERKEQDMEILTSVKGISDVTAAHFIAEIKDIARFDNRNKLIAFAGTDPAVKQSGTSLHKNGRITKKGSKALRRVIYLMAMGVMKYTDHFRIYYDKKRAEGMQHRKAMIALCNKLLRVLYALLSKKEVYVMK